LELQGPSLFLAVSEPAAFSFGRQNLKCPSPSRRHSHSVASLVVFFPESWCVRRRRKCAPIDITNPSRIHFFEIASPRQVYCILKSRKRNADFCQENQLLLMFRHIPVGRWFDIPAGINKQSIPKKKTRITAVICPRGVSLLRPGNWSQSAATTIAIRMQMLISERVEILGHLALTFGVLRSRSLFR